LRDQLVDRLIRLLALIGAVQGAALLELLDRPFQMGDVLGEVQGRRSRGVGNIQLLILAVVFGHAPGVVDQRVEGVDVEAHLLLRGLVARRLGDRFGRRILGVALAVAARRKAERGGECERGDAGAGA
jgi:hypothetical protein